MSVVVDFFENEYIKALLIYDEEREVDKWVVEYEYSGLISYPPWACSAYVETFKTEKEARKFFEDLVK